ncbi:MAG: prepilin-type N-terminal cleavage/methylation domain-containing protein [Actinomycetota bacterium]|nr:prepilin-type N-terminal cleavage/methylation domain-containing protein [Actinomycetota bacterium]
MSAFGPGRRSLVDEGGFTLTEVLVAMTMMVVVLFSLYAVFETTVRVFDLAGDELEAAENARLGLGRMEREIRAAYPQAGGVLLSTWEPTLIAFQNKPTDDPPETVVYSLSAGSPNYLRRNGQRLAGPLAGSEGLRFAYCKSATDCSSAVGSEGEIALVRVTLGVRAAGDPDTTQVLTTDVALRNRE